MLKLETVDSKTWDNFIKNAVYSTIFHTSGWLGTFSDKIDYVTLKNQNGEILAGVALPVLRKLGFRISVPPPLTPYMGILYNRLILEKMSHVKRLSAIKEWTIYILEYIKKNYHFWYTVFPIEHTDFHPFIWNKMDVFVSHTYILDLSIDEESLWKNIHSKRRNDINRSIRDDIRIVHGKESVIKDIITLVRKTFERQQIVYNAENIAKLPHATENFEVFIAYRSGKPLAGVVIVWDKKRAYYIAGGYDHENKHSGAQAHAMWEAIKYSKHLGLKEFDFEGSIVPNIERFFRGFGGNLIVVHNVCYFKNWFTKKVFELSQKSSFIKRIRRKILGR